MKFLINSYNLIIPDPKGNILLAKNSLDEIVISIIAIDNVEKPLFLFAYKVYPLFLPFFIFKFNDTINYY